jgi:dimethylamine monooxygenase subunit B
MSVGAPRLDVTVTEVVEVNPLIKRFRFERADGGEMPHFSGGSHVVVEMDDHGTRRMNPYSLMSDPSDTKGYEISVRRDEAGRGGSLFMHRHVVPGMRMQIGHPVNLFPAGCAGEEAPLPCGRHRDHAFHVDDGAACAARRAVRIALFRAVRGAGGLCAPPADAYRERVHVYVDDKGQAIDLKTLLATQPLGTHLYVCGPKGMITWVKSTAQSMGWPSNTVHSEEFLAPPVGQPFEVELAASGKTIKVGAAQSILEAIEAAGVEAPYLCRGGACGQCETNVVRCDGHIHHHDHWLSDDEKASGTKIMPCVSRFEGKSLVLDR